MADSGQASPNQEILGGEINDELQKLLRKLSSATGAVQTKILKEIQEYAITNLEAWENQKVCVGVVGEPGAGKSTFINSFRGLRPNTPGAAAVGVTHTTAVTTDYPHPARPDSLVFVDFPGVLLENTGSAGDEPEFHIQQYIDKHGEKMEQCHVLLVFSSCRLQHNAVQIGMKAREMGKKVLFVRSKFDEDLDNKQEDDPEYFKGKTQRDAETDLMEELRQDCIKVLKRVGWEGEVDPKDVFIISGRLNHVLKGSWDIPKFRKAMIESFDALQKMVVINTCRDFSKATIKERGDVFRSKVWLVAMATTASSFVPYAGAASIPGALTIAYQQYKEGFGITEDAVEQLAKMTDKSPEDLKQFLPGNFLTGLKGPIGVSEALLVIQTICAGLGLVTAAAVDQTVDMIFPVIGALVTVPLAYSITTKVLRSLISRMEDCAGELFDYAFKESAV